MHENLFRLDGETVLLTGASSGIGRGIAPGLAKSGANLVLCARRKDRLDALVSEIEAIGGQALAVSLDVTNKAQISQAFDQAEAQFGLVDVLINNAGVGYPKPFLETTDEHLEFTLATNFRAVWDLAKETAQRLVTAHLPGSIINISSLLSLGCKPNNTAYCSSKGAVSQLTRAMALDLGPKGIRVNAIAPGWFVTEMSADFLNTDAGQSYLAALPSGRAGKVEELLGPVLMLASRAGSFVNGVVLPVDGAHSVALI